jgi:hypothetical protein
MAHKVSVSNIVNIVDMEYFYAHRYKSGQNTNTPTCSRNKNTSLYKNKVQTKF